MAKWDMSESLAKSLEKVLAFEYVNLRVLNDEQARCAQPAPIPGRARKSWGI